MVIDNQSAASLINSLHDGKDIMEMEMDMDMEIGPLITSIYV